MDRKRQNLSLGKNEIEIQCQEEEMTVLRQKVIHIEAELKLKNEERDHLVERVILLEQEIAQKVTSLEQQLAEKEAQLKLKIEEKDQRVKRVTSLEQELAQKVTSLEKETQVKLKNEERGHLEKRVTSLEKELKTKENQLQLVKEPFDALPKEVVVEIFKHLTQNELGKIARVCQRWNALTKSSVLWQKVNVKFHISHNDAFVTFINRLPCSPTSIIVHFPYLRDWIQPLDFQDLCEAMQGKCHQLEQLVLERSDFTTSLSSIVDLCTQFLPNLTSLAIPYSIFLDCPTRVQCTETSRIKILDLSGLLAISCLNKPLFSRMPCLKELNLSHTCGISGMWFNNVSLLFNQIVILHLGYTNIYHTVFQAIKEHGQNLKELYMCMTQLDEDDLNLDTPAFRQLEIICLRSCKYVTCEGVVSLLRSCPSLQNIYVDNGVALSYARHSYIIANPGKLGIVKNISCRKHIKKYE